MGEPITEASGSFGDATCKVVFSEPCRETRGRPPPNLGTPTAACPKYHETFAGRTKTSEGPQQRAGVMEKERRVAWGGLFG